MVDAGGKVDLRWLEWVVRGEVYGEKKDSSRVWTIALFIALSVFVVSTAE